MSTRQPSLLRKAISVLASVALVLAFVPIAWAEGAEGGEEQYKTIIRIEGVQDGIAPGSLLYAFSSNAAENEWAPLSSYSGYNSQERQYRFTQQSVFIKYDATKASQNEAVWKVGKQSYGEQPQANERFEGTPLEFTGEETIAFCTPNKLKVSLPPNYKAKYKFGEGDNWSSEMEGIDVSILNGSELAAQKVYVKISTFDSDTSKMIDYAASKYRINGQMNHDVDLTPIATEGGFAIDLTKGSEYVINIEQIGKRTATFVINKASFDMLSTTTGGGTLCVGHGDKNDVTKTIPSSSNSSEGWSWKATMAADTSKKLNISIAINSQKYFIPTIRVNEDPLETFDTGVKDASGNIFIGAVVTGEKAAAETFTIDLSMGAVATVNKATSSESGVDRVDASYSIFENGKETSFGAGTEMTLTVKDSDQTASIENAVSSFDLSLVVDKATAAELNTPVDIAMKLDTNVYKSGNYTVFREHGNEQPTDLKAAYDSETGTLSFSSNKFSRYTIVKLEGGNDNPPGTEEDNNKVRIQLDNNVPDGGNNGVYDSVYKQNYGTIYYSTNYKSDDPDSATWTELDHSLKTEDGAYDIPSSDVAIKIIYSDNAKKNELHASGSEGQSFEDGVAVPAKDVHIQFGKGNSEGNDPDSGTGPGEGGNDPGSDPVTPPSVPNEPVAPVEPQAPPISNTGSGDSASTTVDVTDKVTTTEAGSTQVAVDADLGTKIVENAVANNATDVVIKAETTTGGSTATSVALPASTVRELAEKTEASVTISTDSAQVTLDKAAVAAVAEQAGDAGSVQLVVQTSEQNANKVQIEVRLETASGTVSDFRGGSVTISVPVTEELAAKKLVCVYIDENGKYTKMPGALSADGKSYVFATGHFSTYAVMAESEANAAIAEQERAEAAAIAKAKPGTPHVKLSSPAKGKLTVKASAKKAKGYRVYYKKAGWKAYKTYTTSGTVKSLSKTFKKLSKGSYTVKVRAFGKTAAGKIAWGAKSKAKKVAVK